MDAARSTLEQAARRGEVVPAVSVPHERAWLREQCCDCGGAYTYNQQCCLQSLEPLGRFDVLECECTECGATEMFVFDVGPAFALYGAVSSEQEMSEEEIDRRIQDLFERSLEYWQSVREPWQEQHGDSEG